MGFCTKAPKYNEYVKGWSFIRAYYINSKMKLSFLIIQQCYFQNLSRSQEQFQNGKTWKDI